jgi:hypothetical protein
MFCGLLNSFVFAETSFSFEMSKLGLLQWTTLFVIVLEKWNL